MLDETLAPIGFYAVEQKDRSCHGCDCWVDDKCTTNFICCKETRQDKCDVVFKKMKWSIIHDADEHDDGYFEEWWNVTNGIVNFRADSMPDAVFLSGVLNGKN